MPRTHCRGVSTQAAGPPAPAVASTMNLDVDSGYLSSLGDATAFQDGGLSGDELTTDPEAAALVAALQDQIAAQLGVDPDSVTITVSSRASSTHLQ